MFPNAVLKIGSEWTIKSQLPCLVLKKLTFNESAGISPIKNCSAKSLPDAIDAFIIGLFEFERVSISGNLKGVPSEKYRTVAMICLCYPRDYRVSQLLIRHHSLIMITTGGSSLMNLPNLSFLLFASKIVAIASYSMWLMNHSSLRVHQTAPLTGWELNPKLQNLIHRLTFCLSCWMLFLNLKKMEFNSVTNLLNLFLCLSIKKS